MIFDFTFVYLFNCFHPCQCRHIKIFTGRILFRFKAYEALNSNEALTKLKLLKYALHGNK